MTYDDRSLRTERTVDVRFGSWEQHLFLDSSSPET